jgi:hypothetical protein
VLAKLSKVLDALVNEHSNSSNSSTHERMGQTGSVYPAEFKRLQHDWHLIVRHDFLVLIRVAPVGWHQGLLTLANLLRERI